MDRAIVFGLVLVGALLLAAPAEALITSVQIVNSTGAVINISYDNQSQSYTDGSLSNPNAFLKICSSNPNSDLAGKLVGWFYKEGSIIQEIDILPARISLADITDGCAKIDLDFGFLEARYPGFPLVGISSGTDFGSATFVSPSPDSSDGMLKGNFTFTYNAVGDKINFTVTEAVDENGAPISTNKKFILVSLRRSNGLIDDSAQIGINESVLLDWSGDSNFYFSVNGVPFGSPKCKSGETLCSDRVCRPVESCPPLYCKGGSPNGICEPEEGCGCLEDCLSQQDSCESGLICLSSKACGRITPTGAVFGGPPAPFECIWHDTYDQTALPDNPVKLFYYHPCTVLREVSFNVKGPFTGARITTFGNDTAPALKPSGKVFGYFRFEDNIPEELFDSVLIQFKISKADLKAKGLAAEDISLQRLDGRWTKLPTTLTSEDNEFYFFESPAKSLSLFAVVGQKPLPVVAPEKPKPAEKVAPPPAAAPAVSPVLIALAILAILAVAGIGYFLKQRIYMPKLPEVPRKLPWLSKTHAKIPKAPSKPRKRAKPPVPSELTALQQRIAGIKRDIERTGERIARAPQSFEKIPEVRPPTPKKAKRVKKISKKAFEELEKKLGKR